MRHFSLHFLLFFSSLHLFFSLASLTPFLSTLCRRYFAADAVDDSMRRAEIESDAWARSALGLVALDAGDEMCTLCHGATAGSASLTCFGECVRSYHVACLEERRARRSATAPAYDARTARVPFTCAHEQLECAALRPLRTMAEQLAMRADEAPRCDQR